MSSPILYEDNLFVKYTLYLGYFKPTQPKLDQTNFSSTKSKVIQSNVTNATHEEK